MKVSSSSLKLLKEYFCSTGECSVEDFPDFEVYSRRGAKLITEFLGIEGITFGKHIYITPKAVSRDNNDVLRASRELVAHEFVHVIQYRRDGKLGFLRTYLRDFWRNFSKSEKWNTQAWHKAYKEIPYEVEARKQAADFMRWYDAQRT